MAASPGVSVAAVVAPVASSASSVAVLAANGRAAGRVIYNDSTAILYLRYGTAAASTTTYTVQIASQGTHVVAQGYRGALTGIWAAANGNALVTEF